MDDECQCGARIIQTSVTMNNNLWRVEYVFGNDTSRIMDMMVFETNDLNEIKFPPELGCPDNC